MHDSFASDYVEGAAYDGAMVRRLLSYVTPHRRLVLLAMAFMLFSTTLELLIPYITKVGIDRYLARLYHVYEAPAAFCDSLIEADPTGNDCLRLDGGALLLRKASMERFDPAARSRLTARGSLQSETYYAFDAHARHADVGAIRGSFWLVPEAQLSRVPPRELARLRSQDLTGITRLALLAAGLIIVGMVSGYGHVYALQIAGQRSMYDVRTALFRHIHSLSLSFFDRNPIGRLVTRATNDIEALNEMFTAVLVNLVKDVILVVGTVAILCALNLRLALIALAVVPVFTFASVVFRRKARGAYREVRRLLAQLNATLAEDLSGIKIIQVFRRERHRRDSYRAINEQFFAANIHQLVIFGVFRPLIELIATTGIALVLVYGGMGVLSGGLTLGALVAFLSYVRQMFEPLSDMSEKYNIMQSAMASSERIFGIMDETPTILESHAPVQAEIRGRVVFDDVSFSYTPGRAVLRNVSFSVEPGHSVAIVGPTGAGKTSLINLLCRLYDPDTGRVMLDGVDLRDLPLRTLRHSIAVVLQDAFIFSRSVEDNVRLGTPMERSQITHAADMVQASGFIGRLPGRFDEIMAERGATLSTGQKQLLCFARALAHDPKILILDEATSSVDPATEHLIQRAIETLMTGRTSIIVAHRLTTIQRADEILVIDHGRIVERGTHQQLLAQRGMYYKLYLLQYVRAEEPETARVE
ncbi:ABC transporter ATP-binding protein [Candidatus Fermentibacteria bacterium]|nr:ABC transporter ATP-binding protein [Candidatus Fermentibacteria bacterium]